MALIVEDGTGLLAAESYASVAEADAYFSARGQFDAWDAADDKEVALRLAADYLTQMYRSRWAGSRATTTQVMDWPRVNVKVDGPSGVRDYRVIPRELKLAQFDLALRTLAGPLVVDLGVEVRRETVDVITVEYVEGSERQAQYAAVDQWLASLLDGGAETSMLAVTRA